MVTMASCNGSPGPPVTSIAWNRQVRLAGAFLIAGINQEFTSSICLQIENHLSLTTKTLRPVTSSQKEVTCHIQAAGGSRYF